MSQCATCGNLAEHVVADLGAGEALPSAASDLESLAGGAARRCPVCRALFLYTYDYEYGALGDGWETASLERVDRERVVAVLLASPPSIEVSRALTELGVRDGDAVIRTSLLAALDVPAASFDAVRKLLTAYLGHGDAVACERLLRHPRAKVRADALYLLQAHHGSLVFRAVAAVADPSRDVREAAASSAFVEPPRDVELGPAIIACLDDTSDEVRSNAAWTLAVIAEHNRDISAALPSLAARVAEDPSTKVRTTAARALVGAVSAGTDCSGIVSVLERLDPTDELRTTLLDAIRSTRPPSLLSTDDSARLWALRIPLDAAWIPDHELRRAIASRRVKRACSYSSMGTAETYWALATSTDDLDGVLRDGVVMPPGETAQETSYEDRADVRDVDRVLWVPFYREQCTALVRSIPQALHPLVIDEYARILAALEEEWAEGSKLLARRPFLDWLVTDGPVDEAKLDRWLIDNTRRSVRHLVQGIRARWLTHDLASAFDAVMTSAERFKADVEKQRTTRLMLLRCGVRLMPSG